MNIEEVVNKQTMSIALITQALEQGSQIMDKISERLFMLEKTVNELQKVSMK